MNVLLTCAGRRNYLVRFFQEALGQRGKVIACDSSDSAPAFMEADRCFVVPPIDHAGYFDALAAICLEQKVRLLISVHDLELASLSSLAPRFRTNGTIVVVSSASVISICQDKWATFQFLKENQILTPETYRSIDDVHRALACGAIRFPLLIKPRWGTSSIGIERIENKRELNLAYEWAQIQLRRTILAKMAQAEPKDCFVFQELLEGPDYGMDMVNDLEGRHVGSYARHKLTMRAGCTDRAVTVNDPNLERLGRVISERLNHVGCLDSDLILTEKGYQVLDLNPRFGLAYPFSHIAGANLPAALLAWANGEAHDPSWLRCRSGVLSCKHDEVAIVDRKPQTLSIDQKIQAC